MTLRNSLLRLGSANAVMLVSQIVTMLALGVVMRGPDLGLFLLCQSIAQTFSAVATLRFDSALPAARSRVELGALLVGAGAATLMSSALLFLLSLGILGLALCALATFSIACLVIEHLSPFTL